MNGLVVVPDADVVIVGAVPNANGLVVVNDADVVGIFWDPLLTSVNENLGAACGGVIKLGWIGAALCALKSIPGCTNVGFGSDKSYIHFYLKRLQIRETYVAFVVEVVMMVSSNLMTLLPVLEQTL